MSEREEVAEKLRDMAMLDNHMPDKQRNTILRAADLLTSGHEAIKLARKVRMGQPLTDGERGKVAQLLLDGV